MNILKSKSTQKRLEKMFRKSEKRHNKYFRRNVHVNHIETSIRIMRIKNTEEFDLEVSGYKSMPAKLAFFFYHIDKTISFKNLVQINDSEFIVTDSKTNKIVSLDQHLKNYPDFINVWVVKKNTIAFLELEIGNTFFTR